MKKILWLLFFIQIVHSVQGQSSTGKVVYDRLYSPGLENTGGEEPTRRVSIYLPSGYANTTDKYPVIYYLHRITQRDSTLIAKRGIDKLLDKAIAKGKIKPVIFVMSDQYTLYRGSFYTNSSLTGKWSDFTAKDLVTYIDQNYRTISNRDSRGIAGHSMGGMGPLNLECFIRMFLVTFTRFK
jgi:S-formylglutathione hydrolase FrmB